MLKEDLSNEFYPYIDLLTGLENRYAFFEYLKSNSLVSLYLINLDNFSSINNSYGYQIGDKLLVEVAKLLKTIKPDNAILFRSSGDVFSFVIDEAIGKDELKDLCESIISFFNHVELYIEDIDLDLKVSISIGASISNGVEGLQQAELALLEAKKFNKSSYLIYDSSAQYVTEKLELDIWINKIKQALEDERLNAFFQPIINNKTNKIEKFECLARIEEDGKIISPYQFMQATRKSGLLVLLTKTIVKQSFKKFSKNSFEFSLNITGNDLQLGYLEDFLVMNAKKYNIDPSRVVLEILEDIVTIDGSKIITQLNNLRRHGFQIAIDDFGAENSNFLRLLDLQPDYLKIDGAFIKNICTSKISQIIVEAIVNVCKQSDIKVIAEYVHSKEVLDKVIEMGIDYSQGYYFSEPTKEIIVDFLNDSQ